MTIIEQTIYTAISVSLVAVLIAIFLYQRLLFLDSDSEHTERISKLIKDGASYFMKRQMVVVLLISAIFAIAIYYSSGPIKSSGFILGAATAYMVGLISVSVATVCNSRTATAAQKKSATALEVSFLGGRIIGLVVAGTALFLVAAFYSLTRDVNALIALGLGSSVTSLFTRIGGGIFSKGADIGSDQIGKLEHDFGENDPRNPGVIANSVGDNVGDIAGTATDIFDTMLVTTVAAMILIAIVFPHFAQAVVFPLAICATAIIGIVLGGLTLGMVKKKAPKTRLYATLFTSAVISAIGIHTLSWVLMNGNGFYHPVDIFKSIMAGIVIVLGFIVTAEYYTTAKYPPVKKLLKASLEGQGTSIITGLGIANKSTLLPALILIGGILYAFNTAGLFGIAIAAVGMISLTGIVLAIDAFGPIIDNASSITLLSKISGKAGSITEKLDEVGNTTKAVTKTYAIGSAAFVSLTLFIVFTQSFADNSLKLEFSLINPLVIIGLLVGTALPYFFTALNIEAVSKTTQTIKKEINKLLKKAEDSETTPNYGAVVNVATREALLQTIWPAIFPIIVTLAVGLKMGVVALGSLVLGATIAGTFLALSMTSSGAAWDNAKKVIERKGRKSAGYKAAVVGDSIGDLYKDSAGPALNPMIKVINLLALLLLPFIA